ncbi:MAG: hypothetical protein A2Z88_08705 [Omnitrophica WOR_2 bacterium GWA2_47_8]|nr:MAG: hypothetical protein A2Z88_08705 [Omnitrophica WOR_2 bacterium GWA2_47_8]
MIAIIIIGVISALAIPNYRKTVERAHRQDAETQLIALHAANHIYRAQTGQTYLQAPTALDIDAINNALGINLISNGMTYSYQCTTPFSDYTATAIRQAPATAFTITITNLGVSPGYSLACTPAGHMACD